jgi:hypothetical protein
MDEVQSSLVLTALFALRCVAPFAFTLAIGYLMNRLVDRWQAEDEAEQQGAVVRPAAAMPSEENRLPVRTIPCWLLRRCDAEKRASCPAANQPGLPCWLARMRVDGSLPEDCPDCPIYSETGIAIA